MERKHMTHRKHSNDGRNGYKTPPANSKKRIKTYKLAISSKPNGAKWNKLTSNANADVANIQSDLQIVGKTHSYYSAAKYQNN